MGKPSANWFVFVTLLCLTITLARKQLIIKWPVKMELNHSLDSIEQFNLEFENRFKLNRRVHNTVFYVFLVIYVVLMVFGVTANSIVLWLVTWRRNLRNLRQVLLVNLAVSDLLLCLITMPSTLMEIVTFSWPLGNSQFLCKLTGSIQAVSVFVSTMTIAAIAIDRYRLIVYPTRNGFQNIGVVTLLLFIWTLAIALASPLFVYRQLIHIKVGKFYWPLFYLQ